MSVIKTVEELKAALKNNVIVEWEVSLFIHDGDKWMEHWEVMKYRLKNKYKCRTKPEKEYIQFTADDWREFEGRTINYEDNNSWYIINWDKYSVYVEYESSVCEVSYKDLLKCNFANKNDYPCGKEVKNA